MNESTRIKPLKEPGDVLVLYEPLPGAPTGMYVLLSVSATCCLAVARRDNGGNVHATTTLVDVPVTDLCLFRRMGIQVDGLQ